MDTQTAALVRLLAGYGKSMSMAGESTESHESIMQKYLLIISALLLLAVLLTTLLFPAASPIVGMLSLRIVSEHMEQKEKFVKAWSS
jgi:hypothetical protein